MRYLQGDSSFCKQHSGSSLSEIMQILVRAESVLGRLVLDMDTAVRDSIRFTFIALKSVLQDKQGRRPRGHTPGTQVLEL
jgi:hypothetical protein